MYNLIIWQAVDLETQKQCKTVQLANECHEATSLSSLISDAEETEVERD